MTATVSPPTPDTDHAPEPPRRRRSRALVPAIVVLVAGLAVAGVVVSRSDTPTDSEAAVSTDSLEALRLAAEAEPTSISAWLEYGNASLEAAVASGDRGEYLAAKDAFDTALALGPDDPSAVTARAAFALNAHDFATALTLSQRAVALNPLNPPALVARVDALVETGRYDEVDAALVDLLDVAPDFAAYARVSYVRELRGDLDGARTAMQQAIASASPGADRSALLSFLGDIELQAGRVDEANVAYSRALVDDQGSVPAIVGQARVQVARGFLEQAAALLDTAITMGPETTPAIVRGQVALLLGDAAGAEAAFRTALDKDARLRDRGENTDIDSAVLLADTGDTAEALRRATAGYEVRRSVIGADAYAWALHSSGDTDAAVVVVEQALVTDTDSPSIRVHAAAIFAATGDLDRAGLELQRAFEGAPWGDLSIRPIAIELATDLGLEFPETWSLTTP
jgi:tetratricopeptide (TPR) repeat protein